MKEKSIKNNPKSKYRQYRKHPIGQRLIVGILCICLSLVSLPTEHFGYLALAAQRQEIVMFPALSSEVRTQTVKAGTELEKLELPSSLTAVCRLFEEEAPAAIQFENLETKAAEAERTSDVQSQAPENVSESASISEEPVSAEEQPNPEEPSDTQEPSDPEEPSVPQEPEVPSVPQEPAPPENPAPEVEPAQEQTETVTIQGIAWTSEPAYDKEKEGMYVFTPVIPPNYNLAPGVELPSISVAVVKGKGKEETENKEQKEGRKQVKEVRTGKAKESQNELIELAEDEASPSTPSCGRISQDTVWEEAGVLNTGELIVEPGVTLTIKNLLTIAGKVTVKGGGTIVRGSANALFTTAAGSEFILEDITLEGNSISGPPLIAVNNSTKFIMNSGSRIQNCVSNNTGTVRNMNGTIILNGGEIKNCSGTMGGAFYVSGGSLTIEYATIEGCSATNLGGAIFQNGNAKVVIKDGVFSNNKTTSAASYWSGGGFLCLCTSSLEIYGGQFINNTSDAHGGCIHHCGCSGTQTDIKGGYFSGNTCTLEGYEGSGGIYYSTKYTGSTNSITLSGKVNFSGDGDAASGTDGVYLDSKNDLNILRKIKISDTLSYPVNLYVDATEGRVIAEGVHEYRLLRERDMKKINFFDVGNSGKQWYAVLDEEKNEVLISEVNPNYGYYVYYISDDTEETVVDDNRYERGDTVQVKPADILNLDGHKFIEWNTKADGSGTSYHPGDTFVIEDDTDLFAVFEDETKVKELSADFYSGSAGNKETKTILMKADAESGSMETPQLKAMEGWTPLGWNAARDQYSGDIAPGEKLTLTENSAYYGSYEKDVTLFYKAEKADSCPEDTEGHSYANVSEEVSIVPAQFTVAPAAVRYGYAFIGWNTEPDGSGQTYGEGEVLETETDVNLYAIFKKPLHAFFYSGGAGEKEEIIVDIPEDAVSGTVNAPQLKAFKAPENKEGPETRTDEGWIPVGWDLQEDGYGGEIAEGEELTLTDDATYYGVYRKEAVLRYEARGIDGFPKEETGECSANVHEDTVIVEAEFTVGPGPERPGAAFTGWNTEPDGSGETYREGDVIKTSGEVTLFAMFQKTLAASFYSGSGGLADVRSVSIEGSSISGTVEAPELKELEGHRSVGWETDSAGYAGKVQAGEEITLTEDVEYYGVYEKDITLSYESEAGTGSGDTQLGRANVHNGGTSYAPAEFTLMDEPEREGYNFLGWNTEPDGSGTSYLAGSRQCFERDTVLYASWKAQSLPYRIEHYQQELEGSQYVRTETEELTGFMDSTVEAQAKSYPGFTENKSHALRRSSGKVTADGGLTLRLFYDRDVYDIDFDLNGGEGEEPQPQSVRYGGFLQAVEAPERTGYNFKGWYLDSAGTQGSQWDFGRSVEENTATREVTLYAKWADETAPVLGKASYGKGHKDVLHWILHKESLKITVPITEEGSGVKEAEYMLVPEEAEEGKKTAQTENGYAGIYGSIGMPLLAAHAGGRINRTVKGKAKVRTRDGETVAEFTVSKDFKGSVIMASSDRAGNVSAKKVMTAENGGIIVEDNAPQIRFFPDSQGQNESASQIKVEVRDDTDGNVSGGLASVAYQLNNAEETSVSEKGFRKELAESCEFTVKVSGAGNHRLKVRAVDNAGNENAQAITVEIRGKAPAPVQEPKTGDSTHVEIYATASMIAGFSYLLLYFREHGMTEEKKEELVSRLVSWAKGKGKIQRICALALIFLVLAYYHSIGRTVPEEWREVYEK